MLVKQFTHHLEIFIRGLIEGFWSSSASFQRIFTGHPRSGFCKGSGSVLAGLPHHESKESKEHKPCDYGDDVDACFIGHALKGAPSVRKMPVNQHR